MATIKRAKAELLYAQATLGKAEVDVRVAEAALKVAQSEEKYAKAWVDYLTLTAPFDGVITARNANTFDFVLPTTGDPTAFYLSPDISPGAGRADLRGRPHRHRPDLCGYSRSRTPTTCTSAPRRPCSPRRSATSRSPGTVTRVSWALNMKSRTLRAEIDLTNPGSQLLPGIYAYVNVIIERPGVRALPDRRSPTAAIRSTTGRTRTGMRCEPRCRRASATASGSRSPIAALLPSDGRVWRRKPLDADRRDGAGDPGRLCQSSGRRRPGEVAPANRAGRSREPSIAAVMLPRPRIKSGGDRILALRLHVPLAGVLGWSALSGVGVPQRGGERTTPSVAEPPTVRLIKPAGPETSSGSSGSPASSRATSARRFIRK